MAYEIPRFDPVIATVPVYVRESQKTKPKHFGTGVFLIYRDLPYLFTVAHVTDGANQGQLVLPIGDKFLEPEGFLRYIDLPPEIPRSADDVDMAYFRLDFEFADRLCSEYVPLINRTRNIVSASEVYTCSVIGYPSSKVKIRKGGHPEARAHYFTGQRASIDTYERLKLDPEFSIALHIAKNNMSHSTNGKGLLTLPKLNGISGSAILAWPPDHLYPSDWSLPDMVGVVHSYLRDEGLLIGTTMAPYLAAIGLDIMQGRAH